LISYTKTDFTGGHNPYPPFDIFIISVCYFFVNHILSYIYELFLNVLQVM